MGNESSQDERIDRLGERLIGVLEQENDPAVILSALALVAAAGCGSMAGDDPAQTKFVAERFVTIFRGVISQGTVGNQSIH